MKKKFENFLILILFSLILFYPSAFSKDKCLKYFDDIKNDYKKYRTDLEPRFADNDFGFKLLSKWNTGKEQWEYARDEDGYYYIGQITSHELVNKLKRKQKIISVDGKDLRKLDLVSGENWFEDVFDDSDSMELELEDAEPFLLKRNDESVSNPFSDFYILSLDLDEKLKKIEARIQIDAAHYFPDTDAMYELAIEELSEKDEDEKLLSTSDCIYSVEKWTEANFANPADFYLANIHSTDYNKFESYIYLKPYTDQIEWMKENGYVNELIVQYTEIGTHLFNIDFNYKNFPFDKQTVTLKLISNQDMTEKILSITDYSKKYLIDFQKKNNIAGWDIVDNRLVYGSFKNPVSLYPSPTVSLEIDLERKSGYYLYKVILPIIIILIVCWASLWINPKELESKLTITIVCLLSLIAYNFIIDGQIPKLAYLTILDWVILTSYFYAALPNVLGIYFYNLYINKDKKKLRRFEIIGKRYGLLSYIFAIFSIILLNVSNNYENASTMISWLISK